MLIQRFVIQTIIKNTKVDEEPNPRYVERLLFIIKTNSLQIAQR